MGTTLAVANQALGDIAAQVTLTGALPNFDGTAAGIAVGTYYDQVVNTVLRQQDYEFSRTTLLLQPASGVSLIAPFTSAWVYPIDCVRVRQIAPAAWPQNDPQPVRWSVQWQFLDSNRVIFTNLPPSPQPNIVYTTSDAGAGYEAVWDSLFTEAVIRLLASVLALDLSGRPDLARSKLEESAQLVRVGGGLDS
jgi:hypothetical protein